MYWTKIMPNAYGKFCYYVATTIPFNYYATNTALPSMTQTDLGSHMIAFPGHDEQKDIAAAIDTETTRIDNLIAKKTSFIELLKEKRQAFITHAVTKGLDPDVPMKDSGVEWIGEVPEHWDVKRLRHVAMFNNSNVDKKSYEDQNQVKLCNYTDVYYNEFITPDLDFMDATASDSEVEKFRLKKGDVIITKDSEDPSDIGIPTLVMCDMDDVVCGYHLTVIKAHERDLSGFIHRSIQAHSTKAHFFVESPGITRFGLDQDAIGDIPICVPPKEERVVLTEAINKETTRIDTLIDKTQRSIELLKERRSAFITAAVTGQIDLREEKQ
jgi:type I restriction enzyme S subunit